MPIHRQGPFSKRSARMRCPGEENEETASDLASSVFLQNRNAEAQSAQRTSRRGRVIGYWEEDEEAAASCSWIILLQSVDGASRSMFCAAYAPLLFPLILLSAHLHLETPHFACFNGTRKCWLARDRNFFRKSSACTNICPTPLGKS